MISLIVLFLVSCSAEMNLKFIQDRIPKFIPTFIPIVPVIVSADGADPTVTKAAVSAYYAGKTLRDILAITDDKNEEDDAAFNVDIIDKMFNQNYENAAKFKDKLDSDHPDLRNFYRVNKKGYTCDEHFCKKHGNGRYGFGICTPYSCLCNEAGAEGQMCEGDLTFDPVYDECDLPEKVKICGL